VPVPATSRRNIHLIANPSAGRGKASRVARRLIRALGQRGVRFQQHTTRGRGHAEELAHQAVEQGADVVLVCGGDGTLHEAAQALAHSPTALAPLPAGRCNDFCRSLGPGLGPEQVAQAMQSGQSRVLDLARVNGRVYCTVGAVGFDAEVTRYVDQMRSPLWGKPAYIYAVLRVLSRYDFPEVRLTWDEGEYQGPILMAAVANTPTYGNAIRIAPEARADDGLLDVCLVRPAGFFRVVGLLPTVLKGQHAGLPEVSFLRTRRVSIESSRPVPMWADGEPVTNSPLCVQIEPGALRMLLPAG